jgi:phospholipid/cholesterol/gamma-HCH transport system permease protein
LGVGWLASMVDLLPVPNLLMEPKGFHPISYCLRIPKTLIFYDATNHTFLHGYYMKGGALEVGKASTVAFVWTSVSIYQLYINAIVTRIMIEIKDIEKSFGETKILKGISTILKPGKRT